MFKPFQPFNQFKSLMIALLERFDPLLLPHGLNDLNDWNCLND
jgi:hypothetical protein